MRRNGVTPELVALLNGVADQIMADLYTLTLSGGAVVQWTGADRPVTVPAARNDALWSEDFTNAAWVKTAATIVANAWKSPTGVTNADQFIESNTNALHVVQQNIAAVSGVRRTHTFYVLANGRQWVSLGEGLQVTASCWFDIINGVVGTVSGTGSPSATITPLIDGWFRITMSFTPVSTANVAVRFQTAAANGGGAYAGDGVSGVYLFGGDAAPGAAFGAYQKTTTVAVNTAARAFTKGPLLTRGQITHKLGLEVSTLDVTIDATLADLISGVSLVPYVVGNGLDGATLKLERAFMADWSAFPALAVGALVDFAGRVTSINSITRDELKLTASSWTVLLNVNFPPDLYQAGCLDSLYDANCGLVKSTFQVSGVVASGATVVGFNTNLTAADHYFDQGQIIFTSGACNGLSRAIKSFFHTSGSLTIPLPLPVAPANGDTFHIFPGCGLTLGPDCTTKFNNRIHFRGTPFTPPVETAI